MTNNTREVEEVIEDYRQKFLGATDKLGEEGIQLYCSRCFNDESFYDWLRTTLHHQLQKARHNWLREEIGRLEGMKIKESHIGIGGLYTAQVQMEVNQAIQTIIDRYQAELDQDKKDDWNEDIERMHGLAELDQDNN